jgi:hypothetical protein
MKTLGVFWELPRTFVPPKNARNAETKRQSGAVPIPLLALLALATSAYSSLGVSRESNPRPQLLKASSNHSATSAGPRRIMWITGEKGLVKGRLRCDTYDSNIKTQLLLNVIEFASSTLHLSAIKIASPWCHGFYFGPIFLAWGTYSAVNVCGQKKNNGGTTGCGVLSIHTYDSIGSHVSTNGCWQLWQQCEQK